MWPNFRSPLIWDVFAVSTYATVSALFWYVGMIPDLATLRDRAKKLWAKMLYGMLAMGWRGSARHWARYEQRRCFWPGSRRRSSSPCTRSSLRLRGGNRARLARDDLPAVLRRGAIYAGFAMVLTLAIPLRKIYGLQDFITMKHLDNMAKILLATGLIVAYGYAVEAFMAFYSGNTYERFMLWNRLGGPYKHMYWVLLFCNMVAPQMLWFRRVRRSIPTLFLMAMIVNLGMWLERYVIVVVSLHRDFLPSSWGMYHGTVFDWATFVGSIGLFLALMFLFIRLLPMISIFEMRQILPEAKVAEEEA
jgi:molybdopterin-containing oxidoreductase family membrane subunit